MAVISDVKTDVVPEEEPPGHRPGDVPAPDEEEMTSLRHKQYQRMKKELKMNIKKIASDDWERYMENESTALFCKEHPDQVANLKRIRLKQIKEAINGKIRKN